MAKRQRTPASKPRRSTRGKRSAPARDTRYRPVRRSITKSFFKWGLTAAIWLFVAGLAVTAYYAYDLPSLDDALVDARRPRVTLIAADGSRFAEFGDLRGAAAKLRDLPAYLPQAVLATEDRRFYNHGGVDWWGIGRAMIVNIKSGRIRQGGSTITQQVAKNLFLTSERTVKRKVQELMLALWLEQKFTKDQILTIYFNRVYFGAGAYGVEAAAERFFGVPPRDLTLYQSAVLAGAVKAPSRLNPISNADAADRRARVVLSNMVDAGYLKPAQARKASRAPAAVVQTGAADRIARYFADWIMDQLPGYVGRDTGDLTVVTTLDGDMQRRAEARVVTALSDEEQKRNVSQAAAVVMTKDGAVRAMVGGRDYRQNQFNRAVQAVRQPGSAFKPFVYLAGLESGLTPSTVMVDAPLNIAGWRPGNYDGKHVGRISLETALARSINTVAAKVANEAGIGRVIDVAERLGITSPLTPDLSLALGTSEVSLLELTGAYGAFATGGTAVWPYGIVEIRTAAGEVLYRRQGDGPPRVIAPDTARAMDGMLTKVVREGTGRAAAFDRRLAGKTGTSQDFRDAWFVGYSDDFVAGVWMGNDNSAPMKRVTGGGLPAQLWRNILVDAYKGRANQPVSQGPMADAPPTGFWQMLKDVLSGANG